MHIFFNKYICFYVFLLFYTTLKMFLSTTTTTITKLNNLRKNNLKIFENEKYTEKNS